jgi:tetratricopeptide (TPR) repeat protein
MVRSASIALLLCGTWFAHAATLTEEVGEKMTQLRQQLEAAGREQKAGNLEMVQKHQRNAQRFIDEARAMLETANAADSNDLDVLLLYGEVLGLQREYDLAAETLRRATALLPNNPGVDSELAPAVWRSLGRALSEVGPNFAPEAHTALHRALEFQPSDEVAADIHQIDGRVYYDQGLYELARRSFDASLAAHPSTPGAVVGLAALDVRDGKVAEAEQRLQALGPLPPDINMQMQPMMLEALKGMDKNRAWFADTAENHRAYAMLLLQVNRLPAAIDPLERALDLKPDDHITWNLLASVYRGLGNAERAKAALQKSLDLEPNQPRTLEFLKALQQAEQSKPPDSIAAPPPSIAAP